MAFFFIDTLSLYFQNVCISYISAINNFCLFSGFFKIQFNADIDLLHCLGIRSQIYLKVTIPRANYIFGVLTCVAGFIGVTSCKVVARCC